MPVTYPDGVDTARIVVSRQRQYLAYLCQPYPQDVDWEAVAALKGVCARQGLILWQRPQWSWRMSGQTTLILVTRAGQPLGRLGVGG
jgi:hypothetical protein